MTVMTHAELVQRARHWLKTTARCRIVLTEPRTIYTQEQPDAIGWWGLESIVVECKVSRSDYRADAKKPHRSSGGMGVHRFYLTPAGLLRAEEVPEPWGLLEVHGDQVRQIVRPLGRNVADRRNRLAAYPTERDWQAEMALLLAVAQGVSVTIKRNIQEMAA